MQTFGLPQRHEFIIDLIDKLIADGYAKLQPRMPEDKEEIEYYQIRTLITVNGYFFIKYKGYVKERRNKWWETFPTRYWWLIAIITYFAGIITTIIQKSIERKIEQQSNQEQPLPQQKIHTLKNVAYPKSDTLLPTKKAAPKIDTAR